MFHLSLGTLRRLIDEPATASPSERRHLAECSSCAARARQLALRAESAAGALADEPREALDIAAARSAVVARAAVIPAGVAPQVRDWPLGRGVSPVWALAAFAVVLLCVIAFTPLRTLAVGFLAIFEARQFVAVPVRIADLDQMRALPDLRAYGTVRHGPEPRRVAVSDAAAAAALTGMAVAVPAFVPSGIAPHPAYSVGGPAAASFTFSAAKARASARVSGRPLPAMPPGLDGSVLSVRIGPIIFAKYHEASGRASTFHRRHGEDIPVLLVAQAPVPLVTSSGAGVREIEQYLLAQPGVPPQLAAEISAIGDPSTTLPIPVPIEKAYAEPVVVQGVHGLLMGDNTGLGSGVLWQKNGIIYGVAGALRTGDVLAVANSLQAREPSPAFSRPRPPARVR